MLRAQLRPQAQHGHNECHTGLVRTHDLLVTLVRRQTNNNTTVYSMSDRHGRFIGANSHRHPTNSSPNIDTDTPKSNQCRSNISKRYLIDIVPIQAVHRGQVGPAVATDISTDSDPI
ncbi:Uncharacterised protein r2_g3890 [Pycnogonum litorale]